MKRIISRLSTIIGVSSIILILYGCESETSTKVYGKVKELPADGPLLDYEYLEQNWDMPTREKFWFTSQGSRFMPYAWFAALEQADQENLFRNTEHMERLRYIPVASSAINPSGLPIGFALDEDNKSGTGWLGFTCAACHTAQLTVDNTHYIVEGGPTMGNFNLFFERLIAASQATLDDPKKFARFAKRVLSEEADHHKEALFEAFSQHTKQLAARQKMNTAGPEFPHDFIGYGRVDAFGIIKNAVTAIALQDPSNATPVDAPVSYPFLWGTNQSDVVQWNGALPNTNFLGPLARNAGEVIGAFGGLQIDPAPWWKRWFLRQKNNYSATVKFENLGLLESWLRDLRSPMLAEIIPALDSVDTSLGRALYQDNCEACHALVTRDDQALPYTANLIRASHIGTDDHMTKNASDQMARTGILEGTRLAIYFNKKFGPVEPAVLFPFNATFGIMLKNPIATYKGAKLSERRKLSDDVNDTQEFDKLSLTAQTDKDHASEFLLNEFEVYMEDYEDSACDAPRESGDKNNLENSVTDDARYCYKARPLTGIWATAPYLHNGSVPSLRDLLTKADKRPSTFWIGSREFNVNTVGFNTQQGLATFQVVSRDGSTHIRGNSNRGHERGVNLSTEEKEALLLFLKTL